MTDTPPTEAPANVPDAGSNGEAAHDDEQDPDGQWTTYATGGASVKIGGKVYRIRRPDMGQLRKLREALQAAADSIRVQADDNQREQLKRQARIDRLNAEVDALDNQAPGYDAEVDRRFDERRAIAEEDLAAGRQTLDHVDAAYLEWWQQVFQTLTLTGVPDRWPSWAADAMACQAIMAHWRDNPLARG